jgi:glycine oxidase
MTDCVIVGGGVIGMLTARELAMKGMDITLLERGMLGQESSWAGGGILSPLYPWRHPAAFSGLAIWSQQHYPELCEELMEATGIDPEWIRSGLLILDMDEHLEAITWTDRFDAQMVVLDREAILQIEPHLADGFNAAILMTEMAQVRNPRLIMALGEDLRKRGIKVKEHTEVTALDKQDSCIGGVYTSSGRIATGQVVVAGGAWSSMLLKEFGIAGDVAPVRGQMLLYDAAPGMVSHIIVSRGYYIIPRRDGHVLVGSTVEHAGFDKSTTVQAATELKQLAVSLIPELERCEIKRHWAGLRPSTATDMPYIGAHPGIEGLYVNTGHYRNGLLLAPASARLMADIITGCQPIFEVAPYSLVR